MPRQPQVWAIRTKGWVELRKGAEPKLKVSKAVLETRGLHRTLTRWEWQPGGTFLEHPAQEVFQKRKVTLTTKIYTGGRPFQWVPYRRFSRLVGRVKDGAYVAVPVSRLDSLG